MISKVKHYFSGFKESIGAAKYNTSSLTSVLFPKYDLEFMFTPKLEKQLSNSGNNAAKE